ncbi:hypothetical protein BZA77DRAFT_357228 [Pyronema omphalodes]|nr:hypothetical protein BZA77DRAFT_357228 [Pyronema omphalodes]
MKFSIIAITVATSLIPSIMGHPVVPNVETKQLESTEVANNSTMKPTWFLLWKRETPSTTIDSKNNTMKPTWRTIWKREDPSTDNLYNNSTMKPTWRTIWKREHASVSGATGHPAAPNATLPFAGTKHFESSKAAKNNTMKPAWHLIFKREQHTTRLY